MTTEVYEFSGTDASNTALGSINLTEGNTTIDQGNDIARALMGAVARQLGKVNILGSSVASAATTDLSTASGWVVPITGTTTITSFGTETAGRMYMCYFAGILTLTHNATSLILPGGANITTAANDVAFMMSLGSGNWRCVSYVAATGYVQANTSFTISNSAPTITLTDTDTGGDCRVSGSSVAGTLTLEADINNEVASSRINFTVDGDRAASITDDGSLLIGDSSYTGTDATDPGVNIQGHGDSNPGSISATTSGFATVFLNRQGSNGNIVELFRSASYVGGMSVTTTTTSFLTSSNKNWKEDWKPFEAGYILDAIEVWDFRWKGTDVRALGVLAQDVFEIFPDAVTVENDNWSVDYSKFVPLLIQEVKDLRKRLSVAGL